MSEDKYILQPLADALKIIDLLGERETLSLDEICKALKFYEPDVLRILYTLEAGGFVIKTEETKYMLSRKFIYYGERVTDGLEHNSLAKPELTKLRDKYGESVQMSTLLPDLSLMFIERVDALYSLQLRPTGKITKHAYRSGSGKVLMASLLGTEQQSKLEDIQFEKKTDNTIDHYTALIKELEVVRRQGFAIDNEELERGLTCVAVPVYNSNGTVQYAISISGATQRVREHLLEYMNALKEASSRISEIMGL